MKMRKSVRADMLNSYLARASFLREMTKIPIKDQKTIYC